LRHVLLFLVFLLFVIVDSLLLAGDGGRRGLAGALALGGAAGRLGSIDQLLAQRRVVGLGVG
jgi:hypothetical protein